MDYLSLVGLIQNPIAGISAIGLAVFIAGIVIMRFAKGRDSWVDTASMLQGSGGSVFIGMIATAYMASHNMIS